MLCDRRNSFRTLENRLANKRSDNQLTRTPCRRVSPCILLLSLSVRYFYVITAKAGRLLGFIRKCSNADGSKEGLQQSAPVPKRPRGHTSTAKTTSGASHMFRRALMVGVPTASIAIGLYACGGGNNSNPSSSQSIQNRIATATPIKHVVVIYNENVSFDHHFATYPNAANPSGEPALTPAA